MIIAKLDDKDGKNCLLMILEPGNIAKLQLGQPIVKDLREFIPELKSPYEIVIGFCPDVEFLADKVRAGMDFTQALELAMKRKEVYVRDYKDAETLTRHKLPGDVK